MTIDHVVITRQLIEETATRCRRGKTESRQKKRRVFPGQIFHGRKEEGTGTIGA